MEATRRWMVGGLGACALGSLWVAACANQASSGVGGESHFVCAADSDCVDRPGNQVCFFANPGSAKGECTDLSVILDAARHSTGGAGGRGGGAGGGVGLDAAAGGASPSGPYCGASQKATYPHPPTGVPPSTRNVEIVTAMYQADLGDSAPNPSNPPQHFLELGFDLDNMCTAAGDPRRGTCAFPSYAPGVTDGKGGIDNSFGQFIQTARQQISGFSSDNYSRTLQDGRANMLLRLENWNGETDDDQVTLSLRTAAPFDSFTPGLRPKWDGTDAWSIASDSVNGSVGRPKAVDQHAYVSGSQLVATIASDADLRLDVGLTSVQDVKLDLRLGAAFIVCTIVPVEEGRWGYTFSKCTLAGRWTANDFIHQLGQFPNPLDNNRPLCRGNSVYDSTKRGICSNVDLNHDPTSGPTYPCDALSVGLTFTTKPALLGDLYPLKPLADPCPSDPMLNPRYDCCEALDVHVPDAAALPACGFGAIDGGSPGAGGAPGTGGRSGAGGFTPNPDASTD